MYVTLPLPIVVEHLDPITPTEETPTMPTVKKIAFKNDYTFPADEATRKMLAAYGRMATAIAAAVSEALDAGVRTDQIEASCMSFASMMSGSTISVE
jgi:hypothetical protein